MAGGRGLRYSRRRHGRGRGEVSRRRSHRQRHYSADGSSSGRGAGAVRGQVHAGHTRSAGCKMSWLQKLLPPKIKRSIGAGKRAVPEGLWIKCESCDAVLYATDLEKNLNVCPKCGHHNRLSARARIDMLLDPEGRFEIGAEVLPVDSLKFKDSRRYPA